jgi:hypothetical protein
MACLLPKLRHHFAEFLNKSSSNRLRILIPSTCVGLRYGLIYISLRSFSWKHRITDFGRSLVITSQVNTSSGFAYNPPTCLNRDIQHPDLLPFSVTPSVKRYILSTGILTCYHRLRLSASALGSDLPWAESPGPGTLGFSAGGILALLIATYAFISSCGTSSAPHGMPSSVNTMLLYQSKKSPKLRYVT